MKEILFVTTMKLKDVMLNEMSLTEKDKSEDLTIGWQLKYQAFISRKWNGGCQRLGGMGNGEMLVKKGQLSDIWIKNFYRSNVLLCDNS